MATQSERRDATRQLLIDAARHLFASDGYDRTSTERIRERAGVSRGALYHHFRSKQDLFRAVFVEVVDDTLQRAQRRTVPGASPLDDLVVACRTWTRAAADPLVATILLEQAPNVLGWAQARDLEDQRTLSLLEAGLDRAVRAGEITVASTRVTARLLAALLAEAALLMLDQTQTSSTTEVDQSIRQFIMGLRTSPTASPSSATAVATSPE
jgi:AcrR family transcriptional regulator